MLLFFLSIYFMLYIYFFKKIFSKKYKTDKFGVFEKTSIFFVEKGFSIKISIYFYLFLQFLFTVFLYNYMFLKAFNFWSFNIEYSFFQFFIYFNTFFFQTYLSWIHLFFDSQIEFSLNKIFFLFIIMNLSLLLKYHYSILFYFIFIILIELVFNIYFIYLKKNKQFKNFFYK